MSTILIFIWIVLICSGCYSYTNLSREALQYEDSTALGEIVRVVLVDSTQIRFKSEPMPPEYVPYCEVLYGHDSIGERVSVPLEQIDHVQIATQSGWQAIGLGVLEVIGLLALALLAALAKGGSTSN